MADRFAAIAVAFATGLVTVTGTRWHAEDLRAGGDIAAHARRRRTPVSALVGSGHDRRRIRQGRVITKRGLVVGRDHRVRAVHIPVGGRSGRHTLVLGAAGSGKTVTQAWIAGRLIAAGHGAVVVDPKGDRWIARSRSAILTRYRRRCVEEEGQMHARLSRFAGLDPERIDEAVRQFEEAGLGDLAQLPGFRGITVCVNRKSGQAAAITLWETEGDMKRSEELAIKARERAVATAGPSREPIVDVYEVVVHT
jgi:heme-degrading monooxygenase HmoA